MNLLVERRREAVELLAEHQDSTELRFRQNWLSFSKRMHFM
jgi:hypothetical protein